MPSARSPVVFVLPLAAVIAGCTVGPNYAPPQAGAPQAWAGPLQRGADAAPADLSAWWTTLGDPALDALVRRALEGNLDLKEAMARIVEARAQRGIVSADGLPQVNLDAGYTRSRGSENIDFGAGGGGGGGVPPGSFNTKEQDLFRLGFDASWEIDVFGRVRRGVEAADADIAASEEDRRAVLVALLADVARNYVELRSFQQRLAIARDNVRIQQDTVDLSRARYEAGLSNELDLKRGEAQLAATVSTLPQFQAQERAAAHRLATLLGLQPGALLAELAEPTAIPAVPATVAVGLPADLLRRRPDIRLAERRAAAATARIGVATADLYPRFTLMGTLGFQAAQLGDLIDANSRVYSIGPSVTWAIFSAGRIQSNIRVQDARAQQALVRYDRAVLTALEETETALVNFAREQDRLEALERSVVAERRAVELAVELNTRGLTDFFTVLDTQRQLVVLQDQAVQSRGQVTANLIALYRALGGGWEAALPLPPAPAQPAPAAPAAAPPV